MTSMTALFTILMFVLVACCQANAVAPQIRTICCGDLGAANPIAAPTWPF
jgi:hypothetical protein